MTGWRVAVLAGLLAMAGQGSVAAAGPQASVVVELFTSQGCSSCPPADSILADLAERDGVIALALHVDYWDHLGWRDSFASPMNAKRQRAYAKAFGERTVFTPQIIVNGRHGVIGSRRDEVEAAVDGAAGASMPAELGIVAEADGLTVTLAAAAAPPPAARVLYVVYAHPQDVEITRGDNSGQDVTYHNVVTSLMRLGEWHGEARRWDLPIPQEAKGVAILVQAEDTMEILGAAGHEFAPEADQ